MNSSQLKPKRVRRSKATIENDLWNALEKLIVEKGFNNLTLTGLAKEADVEPPVIYKRFSGMDEILEKYVRRYDYWLSDLIKINPKNSPKDNLKKIFIDLVNELYSSEIMQRVLLWELINDNPVTGRMATNREDSASALFHYFNENLDSEDGYLEPATAILIAGIYYLTLHRKISTFCKIDFDTEEGKTQLTNITLTIIEKLFLDKNEVKDKNIHYSAEKAAKILLENGIDRGLVSQSTGLSQKEINGLLKN